MIMYLYRRKFAEYSLIFKINRKEQPNEVIDDPNYDWIEAFVTKYILK